MASSAQRRQPRSGSAREFGPGLHEGVKDFLAKLGRQPAARRRVALDRPEVCPAAMFQCKIAEESLLHCSAGPPERVARVVALSGKAVSVGTGDSWVWPTARSQDPPDGAALFLIAGRRPEPPLAARRHRLARRVISPRAAGRTGSGCAVGGGQGPIRSQPGWSRMSCDGMGRAARCLLCCRSFSARPSPEPRLRLSAHVALR